MTEFDFGLVALWADENKRHMADWAEALVDRDYRVAVLSPAPNTQFEESDVSYLVLSKYRKRLDDVPSASELESRYEIPSLDHFFFAERQYFSLSRPEVPHGLLESEEHSNPFSALLK